MAGRAKPKITDKDFTWLTYFEKLLPLFERLMAALPHPSVLQINQPTRSIRRAEYHCYRSLCRIGDGISDRQLGFVIAIRFRLDE